MADSVGGDRIERALSPRERVVWRARPQAWRLALGKLFLVFFALCWSGFSWSILGFTIFGWVTGQPMNAPPAPVLCILLLFSVLGAFFVYSAVDDLLASWSTYYALTDRRVIVAAGGSVTSYERSAFALAAVEGGPKTGTIAFAWGPAGRSSVGFCAWLVGVPDPHRVLALIRETLKIEA